MIVVRFADDSVLGFEYEADASGFWQICVRDRRYSHSRCIRKRHGSFGLGATQHSTGGNVGKVNRRPSPFWAYDDLRAKRMGGFQLQRRRDVIACRHDTESEGRTAAQAAPADSGTGEMAGTGGQGLLCIPRGADELSCLVVFRVRIAQLWKRALMRRSQRARRTWKQMPRLIDDWLPRPRILHPWPERRFDAKHPRWSRVPKSGSHGSMRGRAVMRVPTAKTA